MVLTVVEVEGLGNQEENFSRPMRLSVILLYSLINTVHSNTKKISHTDLLDPLKSIVFNISPEK